MSTPKTQSRFSSTPVSIYPEFLEHYTRVKEGHFKLMPPLRYASEVNFASGIPPFIYVQVGKGPDFQVSGTFGNIQFKRHRRGILRLIGGSIERITTTPSLKPSPSTVLTFPSEVFLTTRPSAESLVIDKNAPILHRRFLLDIKSGLYIERFPRRRDHVGPPVPEGKESSREEFLEQERA